MRKRKLKARSSSSGTLRKPRGPTSFSRQHPCVDLIFNQVSGKGDPTADLNAITAVLAPSFQSVRIWHTTPKLDGFALAISALSSGATLLVACGGDGTVAAVAAALKVARRQRVGAAAEGEGDGKRDAMQCDGTGRNRASDLVSFPSARSVDSIATMESDVSIVLGVIPRGTANALCAALHIPTDIVAAAGMIASGQTRRIDCPSIVDASMPPMLSLPVPPASVPLPSTSSDLLVSSSPSQQPSSPNLSEETSADPTFSLPQTLTQSQTPVATRPHSMLLLAGIGLEAETVLRAHRRLKRALGAAAYALVGLGTIWRQRHFRTDVTLHNVTDTLMFARGGMAAPVVHLRNLKVQGITVANAAPPTSVLAQGIGDVLPDDGLLEVVCITCPHPLAMIRTMVSMLCSALLRRREMRGAVYGLRAQRVTIECEPPQPVVVDGEDAGYTPITIQLAEQGDCVDVIAPKAGTVNRQKRRISRSLTRLWRNIRGFTMFAMAMSLLNRSRRRRMLDSK